MELHDRIENQERIEELLLLAFEDKLNLNFEQFKEVVSTIASDMYVTVYNLIRTTIPIQYQLPFIVDKMKIKKNNKTSPLIATPKVLKKTISVMKMIENSPNQKNSPTKGNNHPSTFTADLSKFAKEKEAEVEKDSNDIFNFILPEPNDLKKSKIKLPPLKSIDSPSVFKIVANTTSFLNKKLSCFSPSKNLETESIKNLESKVYCGLCNSELPDQNSCCKVCSSKASEISHSGYLYT